MTQQSSHKSDLQVQIREAYGRLVYTYTAHLKRVERTTKWNKWVKYAQIILSAISTGGFIGAAVSNQNVATWIGGIFATVLLALNLFFKDFNLVEEINQHRKAADELWLIREQYISLLTDLSTLDENLIMQKRDELQIRTYEIYKQAPKTDPKSYSDARRALQSEEEQFFLPNEIDRILPSHLRTDN